MSFKAFLGAILVIAFAAVSDVPEAVAQSTDPITGITEASQPGSANALKKRRKRLRRFEHKAARDACLKDNPTLQDKALLECIRKAKAESRKT